MRVLVSTESIGVKSGVALQTLDVCRELATRGYEIDLLFLEEGVLRPEWEKFCRSMCQIPTATFNRKRAVRDLISLAPSVKAAMRSRPDVIYVNRPQELAFGLLAGLVARAPVICHVHHSFSYPLFPRLAARANRVVVVSEFLRNEYIEKGVAPSQVVTIHNGITLGDYPPATARERATARQQLDLPEDAFIALFFGRLDKVKGVDVLLRAWAHLALPPDVARLLIVGSTVYSDDAQAELKDLHALATPGCHWLPMQRDVVTPLHAADVVAVPSTWDDPFPRTVLEGLAAGLPVIAARVGGIPEMLDRELTPFLFERGSDTELAALLASLVTWREERPQLGRECSAHAARFGIGQMVDNLEPILQDSASKRVRARREPVLHPS
jgi:glycosyltransferase involved in cell wall biosynthesis